MVKALSLAIALILLAAPAAGAASKPSAKLRAGAEETVLRLHDLPPGYRVSGDSGCVAFGPTGFRKLRTYDRWAIENRPEGCEFEYERRFRVPGDAPAPPRVKGETINTPSDKAAEKGFPILFRLILRLTNWESRGTVSLGPAGPTANLFHTDDFDAGNSPGSLLIWRQGKLLAALEAGGLKTEDNDSAALYYAQIQQRRLEFPAPYTEAERDDTEVMLDDPGLKLPVYWLGRTFEPEGGPSAELQTATVVERGGLPGAKLELRYDGFNLETWTRPSWRLFQDSILGKLNRPPCTRTYAFEWEQGHAIISAGYRRRTFDEGCPDYPPTRYWAVAHVGGVVIGVNQTTCRCLSPGFGPFSESLRGMKTVLRGLTLRPKPTYDTESASSVAMRRLTRTR
jgi:hypothetical protein